MPKSLPNIIWYCTDQQRYDTIASLGNDFINTPNIDKFIKNGFAYKNAYVQSPICTPSRSSFLTGRYPATTHAHRNGADYFPPNEILISKMLKDAGYDCGLVGKLHLAAADGGVEKRSDDGYRVFQYSHDSVAGKINVESNDYKKWLKEEKKLDLEELYAPINNFCCDGVPEEYHQTTWCTDMAIKFIEEPRDKPWMLSINPFDPHPPFDPPKEFRDKYNPEDLPSPLFRKNDIIRQKKFSKVSQQAIEAIDPSGKNQEPPKKGGYINGGNYPPESFNGKEVKAAYYAMIELIDKHFGRLVDYLKEKNELENTLIIFHSDHGEMLGDHGLIYKGSRFFEGLVHVPLIFSWENKLTSNVVSDALVELVDIVPTILEAAGIKIPYYIQGKSLMPMMIGEKPYDFHKPFVVSEFNDSLGSPKVYQLTHATMVFDGRYKTIIYHGLNFGEIYDLEKDPGEFDDLWDSNINPDLKFKLLHKHIDAVMSTSSAGVERIGRF